MAFKPLKKGTLLIPSGPSVDAARMHLFVICSDTCGHGKQVLVPIASWLNDLCDDTCILQPHEHRFLKQKSYMLYRYARVAVSRELVTGVSEGVLVPREDMNGQTFQRIKNGISASDRTPRKVKKYWKSI
jgi:hypothetical protein